MASSTEKKRRRVVAVLAAAALSAGLTAPATAQDFPEKPVEMTVLFGGTAQTIGQLLAELMGDALPKPVVAVSRTGGGGAVGYSYVHSTDPDGYNIVWNSNSISTTHHGGKVPFDYTAFEPIARVSVEVPALAVRADSGWDDLASLAEAVKTSDDKLKVGISGFGSFTHLTSAALFDALGIADRITFVPYGSGKAPVELLAGRIDAAVQWPGQFVPHQQSGDLSILCVTSKERIEKLPDTTTCAEAGADGLDIAMWRGLAAPVGTPEKDIKILEDAARKAVEAEQFKKAAKNIGFEISFLPSGEFGALIARDDEAIGALMDKLGLKQN